MAHSLQHALFCEGENCMDRDLVALNCMRGIDTSLPTYNEAREMFGLEPREDFDWSTCQGNLEQIYSGDIDVVELFIGGSCESPVPGAVLGETFLAIVKNQFLRLRDNDPNWMGHRAPYDLTYKDVIERSTSVDLNLLFHPHSSFLHHSTTGDGPTSLPTTTEFMVRVEGLHGNPEDIIDRKKLDQDSLHLDIFEFQKTAKESLKQKEWL